VLYIRIARCLSLTLRMCQSMRVTLFCLHQHEFENHIHCKDCQLWDFGWSETTKFQCVREKYFGNPNFKNISPCLLSINPDLCTNKTKQKTNRIEMLYQNVQLMY